MPGKWDWVGRGAGKGEIDEECFTFTFLTCLSSPGLLPMSLGHIQFADGSGHSNVVHSLFKTSSPKYVAPMPWEVCQNTFS